MNIKLVEVTESNFWDVINLKSDLDQEKRIQIFERWVGSNAFFLAVCQVYRFTPKAIYDSETLIGFTSHGFHRETNRFELISIMLGHAYQKKGYGMPILRKVIEEMIEMYSCEEIYLSVIYNNDAAIRVYEKAGFKPTGEIEKGHHPEPIYKLVVKEYQALSKS
ncbi:GNAT family N-acetyltransferase [Bacillus sp. S/N-304-OC-R1]|uniref:GNAT family N-acetyltransferase n=1 Tax=Bacillus sp. S/N-304-OC-R1 TaxID=2758034 RepID=UPI001C8D3250|nr:GNAT family N-acetyltransferase [Bacillus sp. S/N-304-OC-R1]MBY0120334.1 GNAT family N-acetyltransferase [Bacillus sp. S/N-304-OC-R1]